MTQEWVKCAICLDVCVIPVEITCFGCSLPDSQKPSCFSFYRVCELCAIQYLEMDKPPEQRSESKRCLFCESTCNPKHSILSYRKDYLLMQLDPNPDVPCPNADCDHRGTHALIEQHYSHECPHTIIWCQCNAHGTREHITSHQHRSQCVFYEECSICHTMVLLHKVSDHYQISHDMKLCSMCHKATRLSINEHLMEECSMRLISCSYCQKYLQAKHLMSHCMEHATECRQRMEILKKVFDKEKVLLNQIIENCKQLY